MTDFATFTEAQVELIYDAVKDLQKRYGKTHPFYSQCEGVLTRALPIVNTRRRRLNAVCDS
jgi:hypothetical protein